MMHYIGRLFKATFCILTAPQRIYHSPGANSISSESFNFLFLLRLYTMPFMAILKKVKPIRSTNTSSPIYLGLSDESIFTSEIQGKPNFQEVHAYTSAAKRIGWFTICNTCLFVTSIALLAFAYARPSSDATYTRQLFSYSPALEAVEYHEEEYQGVFHQPSIYRGRPTDEMDKHRRKLWACE